MSDKYEQLNKEFARFTNLNGIRKFNDMIKEIKAIAEQTPSVTSEQSSRWSEKFQPDPSKPKKKK